MHSYLLNVCRNHREAKEYCMRFLSNEAMVIAAIKHRQEVAEDPIINKPELCIMCTLHMELRIGEYCLTELARELHNLEATTRNQKMEEMGSFIAGCFGGSRGVVEDDVEAGEQVHDFKVSMDKKNTKQIATIKMSAARQKKVMRHIDDLVDIVMTEQLMQQPGSVNTNAGYKILFQKYKMVLETMQRVDDIRNDPVAIAAVQKLLDDFSNHFHSMFGPTKVTNYIHALCSGHCRLVHLKCELILGVIV